MKFKTLTILFNSSSQRILLALLACGAALVINILVFLIPLPISITRVISNFYPGLAFLLIVFLGTVFSRKGIVWDTISLTLALILFCLPVIYKWQTAFYNGSLIGGLLPWSDAHGYYEGAYHLIYNGVLTTWATRRPLFGGFLAVILSVSGNNLQVTLALLAIFNGLASFLASREIQKFFGPFSAAIFLIICFWFYWRYAGLTLSEQLGLCLGSLGVAFLVRGMQNESIKETALGLFLLTVALNARAGAFLILPALILWLGIYYRKTMGWLRPILIGVVIVTLGMLANLVMVKMIGPSNAAPFSNYSYTLYGLASGNQGWAQLMKDYPDVKEEDVLNLAIQKIRERPTLFIVGILRSYQDYFSLARGQFSFMYKIQDQNYFGSRMLWILTWVGLISAVLKHKDGHSGLALAAFLGIFLSAGLVPPIDADYMRVYAATIPVMAFIVSMGIAFITHYYPGSVNASDNILINGWMSPNLLWPFSIILLLTALAGPLLIKISAHYSNNALPLSCPAGEKEIVFLTASASSIALVDNQSFAESYLPNIRVDDFKKAVRSGPTDSPFLIKALQNLERGQVLSIGTYQEGVATELHTAFLITQGQLLNTDSQHICVMPSQDDRLKDYSFFYYEPKTTGIDQVTSASARLLQNLTLVNRVRDLYKLSCLLVCIIALLNYLGFWSALPVQRLFLLGNLIFIFAGVLIYLHSNAFYPLAWEKRSLDMKDAIYRGGYSYELPLGIKWMDRKAIGDSPAIIYENGDRLNFPNATLVGIERLGKGRYSVERGSLFFSSSNNSDPRANHRHYELYWPTPISQPFQWLGYTLAGAGILLLYLYKSKCQINDHATV